MSKTLLNGVNEILKRVSVIAGDSSALTSLTDSARQVDIDIAVQVINEAIDEIYSASNASAPNQVASSTVVLATGTRAYALASGVVRLHWPLIDRTHTKFIFEYKPGYDDMLLLDPEQDDTGTPYYGCIRPTDGYLFLDRAPLSADNGNTYTYQYDKNTALSAASDAMPVNDEIFRALVPAWVQLWKRERRNEFDKDLFKTHLGRAARLMPTVKPASSYNPRPGYHADWPF